MDQAARRQSGGRAMSSVPSTESDKPSVRHEELRDV
jgi:hypothetical protein